MNLITHHQFLNYQIFDNFLLFNPEPIENNKNKKNVLEKTINYFYKRFTVLLLLLFEV